MQRDSRHRKTLRIESTSLSWWSEKVNRKVQEEPQAEAAANHLHQEEEKK